MSIKFMSSCWLEEEIYLEKLVADEEVENVVNQIITAKGIKRLGETDWHMFSEESIKQFDQNIQVVILYVLMNFERFLQIYIEMLDNDDYEDYYEYLMDMLPSFNEVFEIDNNMYLSDDPEKILKQYADNLISSYKDILAKDHV